nr:NADH-quinone oxidoreductase subunit N [Helicobacter bizzozeronii]
MDSLLSFPDTQTMQEFSMLTFLPLLISAGGGICLLLLNAFKRSFSRDLNVSLVIVFLALNLLAVWAHWSGFNFRYFGAWEQWLVGHALDNDAITFIAQTLIVLASLLLIILVFSKERFAEFQTPEFYPLYLFMVAGFELMVSSQHLLLILIGLESASLAMCVLMALNNKKVGIEAGLKYFTMGMLASVFFVLGTALFYLKTGQFRLWHFGDYGSNPYSLLLTTLSLAFIIGALGFKVSLVPFHTWMPDIYEGNNPVFAAFISIVPKIAGLAVLMRIINYALVPPLESAILTLATILIALTITIPNVLALLQKDAKRMMAYSSISHAGFALLGVITNGSIVFTYWIYFLFTNIGAFAFFWLLANKQDSQASNYAYPYERFNGLIKTHPALALLGAVFIFSLAGIPPFSLFWGKLIVLQALMNQGMFLPMVIVINSAISVAYYFKILVAMFFKPAPQTPTPLSNASPAISVLGILMAILSVCPLIGLGFYWGLGITPAWVWPFRLLMP